MTEPVKPSEHPPRGIPQQAARRAQARRSPGEELAAGRARSLRELAERDGITRRYVRRLVDLAFLSPELVEVIP